MATRLFVGNLPENTQENELNSAFASFGQITSLDLKTKSAAESGSKTFAFVTLSASNFNVESCMKHFSSNDFNGQRLYVTRARESFLERLQRERAEVQQKQIQKDQQEPPKIQPVIKLSEKLNPRKRKSEYDSTYTAPLPIDKKQMQNGDIPPNYIDKPTNVLDKDKKKMDSEIKRMEAMKKKREEFKTKQRIVKTGLTGVDKVQNKKVIFSDNEEDTPQVNGNVKSKQTTKSSLFDDNDASDDEVNFEIKKQFEGKKGQKVLDLQSRYKSDKRFVLDERFIEEDNEGNDQENAENEDQIEVNQADEKSKQLDILQDVLGVSIKRKKPEEEKDWKTKPKMGMLRFDPMQPDHAKFLAPVDDTKQQSTKKSKKKKDKEIQEEVRPEEPRPEVSKETFYKVSDTFKEAIAQPTTFSFRSMFGNKEVAEEESKKEDYIPLEPQQKKTKVKNPMDPGEKNPFKYDSSDSESEEPEKEKALEPAPVATENKAVWKESLFFGPSDQRLTEGLTFFNSPNETEPHKERRELKSLMKKRIYNKERKNQMFQKKIGGRKKTMKKSFKRKS